MYGQDPVDHPSKLYHWAVKGAKITKMMKRTTDIVAAAAGLLWKSCSEIVNVAHMTKALAASQLIFKSKRFRLSSRTNFCNGMTTVLSPQSGTYNGSEGINPPAFLFGKYHLSRLFSLSENEVRAGRPLAVPGQPQDESVGGHPNHWQQWVCCLGGIWTAAKITSESALTRSKKILN
jgi:hypothetical protein